MCKMCKMKIEALVWGFQWGDPNIGKLFTTSQKVVVDKEG